MSWTSGSTSLSQDISESWLVTYSSMSDAVSSGLCEPSLKRSLSVIAPNGNVERLSMLRRLYCTSCRLLPLMSTITPLGASMEFITP